MNTQTWPADAVERRAVDTLVPYARNSRTHSPEQISQIAASVREFGFTNPVLVDEDGTIIAGHGRVLAAQKLDLAEIPVMVARGWTDAQRRAYVLADNQIALNAGWNVELLQIELADLHAQEFNLGLIGFDPAELTSIMYDAVLPSREPPQEGDNTTSGDGAPDPEASEGEVYSRKITAPIYEPKGECPPVSALVDNAKTQELVAAINAADLPADVAAFLTQAAERHTVFNFARIADFYAHAEPALQRLMEASALVIIDFEQAIESGFVSLTKRLGDLVARDYPDAA